MTNTELCMLRYLLTVMTPDEENDLREHLQFRLVSRAREAAEASPAVALPPSGSAREAQTKPDAIIRLGGKCLGIRVDVAPLPAGEVVPIRKDGLP